MAMISIAGKLSRAARVVPVAFSLYKPNFLYKLTPSISLFSGNDSFNANPVALQMINYALSLTRSHKSDESYAQGLLVLEQCQSTQPDDNSKGLVLLPMSALFSERRNFDEAIAKLQRIQDLTVYSMAVRVAAMEALVGLHLELGQRSHSFKEFRRIKVVLAMLFYHMESSFMPCGIFQWQRNYMKR